MAFDLCCLFISLYYIVDIGKLVIGTAIGLEVTSGGVWGDTQVWEH